LYCQNNQQEPSKGNLQSLINYVTNINTTLYSTSIDVERFQKAYTSFIQSNATLEERIAMVHELLSRTQEVKLHLQAELDALDTSQMHKTMFAKGILETIGSSILIVTAPCILRYQFKHIPFDTYPADTSRPSKILSTIPFNYMRDFYLNMRNTIFGQNASENTKKASDIAFSLSTLALGIACIKNGLKNCKDGWNYKAYLEEQIKNIDEIILYIHIHQ
jgi:hypothetical protein